MAAAAALTKVTAAQCSYDTELVIANRKKSPPGGGNVNKRQLEAALNKMKARWTEQQRMITSIGLILLIRILRIKN